jgi:hypothetical protein
MSLLRNPDKLWHFLVSIGLVLIFYTTTVLWLIYKNNQGPYQREGTIWKRLTAASIASFSVGLVKEAADYVSDDWQWCQTTCHFDIWDLVVIFDGAVVGSLLVVLHLMYTLPSIQRDDPCTDTVASTVDDLDLCRDDELGCESKECGDPPSTAASSWEGEDNDGMIPVELRIRCDALDSSGSYDVDDDCSNGNVANDEERQLPIASNERPL